MEKWKEGEQDVGSGQRRRPKGSLLLAAKGVIAIYPGVLDNLGAAKGVIAIYPGVLDNLGKDRLDIL